MIKHLKAKLLASLCMLLVATVLMSTASFAWFTISTNPEMKGLGATVVTNENLEIALAHIATAEDHPKLDLPPTTAIGDSIYTPNDDGSYTWGNLIDFSKGTVGEIYQAFMTGYNITLRPTTFVDEVLKYPVYDKDGRIKEFKPLMVYQNQYGFGYYYAEPDDADVTDDNDENDIPYGFYIDFWVRSNVEGNLTLVNGTTTPTTAYSDAQKTTYARSSNGALGQGTNFIAHGATEADKAFVTNLRLQINDITPGGDEVPYSSEFMEANMNDTTKISPSGGAGTNYSGSVEKVIRDIGGSSGYKYMALFNGTNKIVKLYPNKAKLIRVYVYLDGENMKNEHASVKDAVISGTLNLQFCLSGKNLESMDGQS